MARIIAYNNNQFIGDRQPFLFSGFAKAIASIGAVSYGLGLGSTGLSCFWGGRSKHCRERGSGSEWSPTIQ